MSATQHSILSISGLSVSFGGIQALSDVSIDVPANSIVGLIGPNGAGKTTLFNSISGLVTPTSGIFTSARSNHKFPKPHELHKYGIARTLQGVGHQSFTQKQTMSWVKILAQSAKIGKLPSQKYTDLYLGRDPNMNTDPDYQPAELKYQD